MQKNMTKGWGGKDMRSSLIDQMDGFVDPFYDESNLQTVRIGKSQSMLYSARDEGPFELSAVEREKRKRLDALELIPIDKQKITKLKKKDLVSRLIETDLGKGLGAQSLLSMHLIDLQEKAKALYIYIYIDYVSTSKTCTGWEVKGKGLL
jgi:hypothetical protein